MSAPRTRRAEISLCNILFCLLVVWIHVSSAPVSTLEPASWQYAIVYFPWKLAAFVVQGFLFLSAVKLFLRPQEAFSYRRFWRSRLCRIVLPYLVWVCIYYVYFVARGYFPFRVGDLLRYMVVGDLSAHFYFIVILVQFYLLMPLWRVMVRQVDGTVAMLLALLISLMVGSICPTWWRCLRPATTLRTLIAFSPPISSGGLPGAMRAHHYGDFCAMLRRQRGVLIILFAVFAVGEGRDGLAARLWAGLDSVA